GPVRDEVLELFRGLAEQKGSELLSVEEEVNIQTGKGSFEGQTFTLNGQNFMTPLLGRHQLNNAATAWLALQELAQQGFDVQDGQVRKGFQDVVWPGRL